METIVFTPSGLLDLLLKIDELSTYDIDITESMSGNLQLQIGDSIYDIDTSQAEVVEVSDDVVDAIDDLNIETYEDLADDGIVDISEPVESGLIKELAKTLLVGGMARLGMKVVKEEMR